MKDKKEIVVLLVAVEGNMSEGARKDDIRSKSASQSYRDNFDRIFPPKEGNQALN
jgi:hypothetical protein